MAARLPKKVAVIGFDCALTKLIEKHIKEGHLPTFKKIIEEGTLSENCLPPYPTITPPNWATIATGAWAGTHGITDFHIPKLGTTPDNSSTFQAFSSVHSKAEFVWDALDKAGKKCIVVNYPGSWPSNMKNGIMVGGSGLTIGENRDGLWALSSKDNLCAEQMITTGIYPRAIKGKFEKVSGWKNLPASAKDALEMSADLVFPAAPVKVSPTTWHVLAEQGSGKGYSRVTLSPTKDYKDAFFTLEAGKWSKKAFAKIKLEDGGEREVFFRAKLIELSDDAEDLRLYLSAFCAASGWSNPPEIAGELVTASQDGIFGHSGGLPAYSEGWFELDTYAEINELHDFWLGDVVTTLLTKHPWDLFYMHSHPPDWAYHVLMTDMDERTCKSKEAHDKAWETHLKIYQSQDRMLARIIEAAGKDTLIVLVSDHGATADGPTFNPYHALAPAGLTVIKDPKDSTAAMERLGSSFGIRNADEAAKQRVSMAKKLSERYGLVPDISKSKALAQRSCHIYINLKGRDPEGVVEPKDYEKVQQEIIDALYQYVDPKTGKRPVTLALSKKDARIIGLYGELVGDVIYAIYPEFGSQHGQMLPTAELGPGSLKSLLMLCGPGIKKGYRMERTCWLTDVVPTICYLMDWPVPETSEGCVVYQAFKDPNFKLEEVNKLKDAIARMETALARQAREPWDKHDCA